MDKDEFEKLKAYWYDKLKESGFHDIELDPYGPPSSFIHMAPHIKWANQDYFQVIKSYVKDHNTKFRNETDRYVMMRHSQGAKIKEITDELNLLSEERDRKTIRTMIRRYEMAWGIRTYTRKELNLKDE